MQKEEEKFKPTVLWFTGLSGSGKSTISERVYAILDEQGYEVEHLDGDAIRNIFPKTGFSREERNAHIKRVGYLASRLQTHGVFVIGSFISPYREARDFVRNLCDDFTEIYVSTPLEVCEQRDVKGLYAKARKGEITQFTGVDDPYEEPENPELTIDTTDLSVEESVQKVLDFLSARSI
ncbi:MAG TPA: adenylyl-sulfate kinase [Balneolaceae bacterium]|nr:adenylyl-sulfate kinase [Balneolaceae bacterium]